MTACPTRGPRGHEPSPVVLVRPDVVVRGIVDVRQAPVPVSWRLAEQAPRVSPEAQGRAPPMRNKQVSTGDVVLRGVVSGLAGTVVMTAFQKLVEMPLTQRGASYAPADFAEKVTPVRTRSPKGRRRLNWITHFALGTMWGAAYGIAAARGLRGQKAVNAVFGVVYAGDVALNAALGLYHPLRWSAKDLIIDVVDKYVQAQGTGAVFDRVLDPAR